MTPDLPTLLLLRLGLEVLVVAVFGGLMRRYPAIGGPGWWSFGSVMGVLGVSTLMLRVGGAAPVTAAASAVLLFASNACAWLGVRSYLQWKLPWKLIWGVLVIQLLAGIAGSLWATRPAQFQLLYVISSLLLVVLSLRDLFHLGLRRAPPEFRTLAALTVSEGLLLVFMLGWVAYRQIPLDSVAAHFLLAFLMLKLLRVMIYGALVSLRLRQDAEHARQAMAERDAESRALVDHLGAGVVVFRPDRSIVRVNVAARRFLRWEEGQPAPEGGRRWQLLRSDGQRMPHHEVPFERVLATGQPVSDVIAGLRVQGEVRWALCNAYPDNDLLGGLRHVVFTFVDITALRQTQQQQRALEQQLAQSQKMEALGTLAGGVAHDFNNILAAILGNAALARQDLAPGAPSRQSLHEISSAARRGRELVRQILAFSRQQPLARQPVDPGAIVAETCSLLRTAITPRVQLVQSVSPSVPAILADPTQLGQVLLNLGTNAIHALQGRPGRIELLVDVLSAQSRNLPEALATHGTQTGRGVVRIRVRDDGCGMDEATRSRMFEPFFTTKGVGQGTGLGLPVVLGIVEAHGGAIAVDSRPDEGTTFSLYFPSTDEAVPEHPRTTDDPEDGTITATDGGVVHSNNPPSAESIAMTESTSAERRHILYLDDDDTLVFLVRRLLERRGYQVTALCDQQEAIDAVRKDPESFHLLMTDYNMPGMSGIDVAREVRSINPRLPVAVASGYISDELQAEATAVGVTEVVFKTDAVEAFCEVVARLVSPARPA